MIGERLVIVGAGEHGRVIADLARAAGWEIAGFVEPVASDDDRARSVSGVPVIGSLDAPAGWRDRATAFAAALGDNRRRAAAWDRCTELGLRPATLVHPTAILLGGAVVQEGGQVCAAAVVGVDAVVGGNAIVNTAATIDHDGRLGRHAQVGPGAHLAGRVTVGEGAFLGTGTVVIPGCEIGPWAVVAAGATVIDDVPEGARVAGVPARPLRGE